MRTCPHCRRAYPEVVGASEQRCPYCGHEVAAPPRPSAVRAPGARPAADAAGALGHGMRFAGRHYPRLVLLWLPVALVQAGAVLAVEAYQRAAGLPEDPFAMTDAERLSFLGVGLPVFFVYTAAALAGWALVGAWALDRAGDGPRGGLLRALLRHPGPLLGLAALLAAVFIAGATLVIPFLVLFHLFLFAPVALAEGDRVGEALTASRRFARERATYGFTLVLLLLGLAAFVLAGQGAKLATRLAGPDPSPYLQPLLEVALGALVWPLLPVFPAAYWHLASREGAGDPATAATSGPGERARTTKCPRCATLIPYHPTGAPVEVRCPACGTSGRVL